MKEEPNLKSSPERYVNLCYLLHDTSLLSEKILEELVDKNDR